MDALQISKLGFKHLKNSIAEEIRIKSKVDITQPIAFYGVVNERCNVKCRQCEYWRMAHYQEEMTIRDWQNALISIKEFVGPFFINFSGGEPFIKKGFLELLDFGSRHNILCGVTTNGSCLTANIAKQTVAAKPFNVNISVDAPNAELHDYLRGQPGLFDKLTMGIRFLLEEQKTQNIYFPIIIKPSINRLNLNLMPAMVRWGETVGATAINFQPLYRWTAETYNELWIEESDQAALKNVIEQLICLKRKGAPIMNSEYVLELMPSHFREEHPPMESRPCRVGLRNFLINTAGDVRLCYDYPVIGNVKQQSAREIWYSDQAQAIREKTLRCNKLCISTVASPKSLRDKATMALKLLD